MIRLREDEQAQTDAVATRYLFDRSAIVVVRDSAGFQAGPRLAVRGVGALSSDGSSFDRTFMLVSQDGRYLLDGVIDTTLIRLD
jgi:hypothetical protein